MAVVLLRCFPALDFCSASYNRFATTNQPFNNQGGKEMRMTMKKLTQGATRLTAALSLFALVRCDGYLV